MADETPTKNIRKLLKVRNAWEELAPTATFAGMTLQQFDAVLKPSQDNRAEIEDLTAQIDNAKMNRDAADKIALAKMLMVVAGVIADPNFGADSGLYEAMGYIPKSKRKSGLTRKSKTPTAEK